MVRLDLPLLKENNEYFGLIQAEISIKEEEEIMTKIEIEKINKDSLFVYIDSLTYVGEEDR